MTRDSWVFKFLCARYKRNFFSFVSSLIWIAIRSRKFALLVNCRWLIHVGSKVQFWYDN